MKNGEDPTRSCQHLNFPGQLCWEIELLILRRFSLVYASKSSFSTNWRNKQQSNQCKILSDGVPIGSGTFATILGGITIWNLWSNKSDANLEDSACKVRLLLFFSINSQKWASKPKTCQITDFLPWFYICLPHNICKNSNWLHTCRISTITTKRNKDFLDLKNSHKTG